MVSILIAVYNAEDYLHRCLDSLLAQTYSDWQAICIDDCSTDSSLSILKEYEQMDRRITIMHLSETVDMLMLAIRDYCLPKGNTSVF